MRYGIPTRVYNLSSDHLGGLLNLMSDLCDWITKGYIIKINVYLEEKDDCGREKNGRCTCKEDFNRFAVGKYSSFEEK
ncbi:MAG TPA: hypothetical protein PLR97_05710 [Bacilli bacterium]|nr:hypothetical protein [Bacilli bacterium]